MFLCPKCKSTMTLPACGCGYRAVRREGVWQLSDMPDMVTDGDGDKYIGYEHIGKSYSGARRYLIEERDALFAGEVARMGWSRNLMIENSFSSWGTSIER